MIFKKTLAFLKNGDRIEIKDKIKGTTSIHRIEMLKTRRIIKNKRNYVNIKFSFYNTFCFASSDGYTRISLNFKFYSDLALLDSFLWEKHFIIKLI